MARVVLGEAVLAIAYALGKMVALLEELTGPELISVLKGAGARASLLCWKLIAQIAASVAATALFPVILLVVTHAMQRRVANIVRDSFLMRSRPDTEKRFPARQEPWPVIRGPLLMGQA